MLQVVSQQTCNIVAYLRNKITKCINVHRESMMRRGSRNTPLVRPSIGLGPIPSAVVNPKMWVQLGEDSQNPTIMLLETIQQLKNEIANMRVDNEWLMRDQERIMKSLSNRQKYRNSKPSLDNGNKDEDHRKRDDIMPERNHTQGL